MIKKEEEREITILDASFLEPLIHVFLDEFPHRIRIRLEYHAARHISIIHNICFGYHFSIPFRQVFAFLDSQSLIVSHNLRSNPFF